MDAKTHACNKLATSGALLALTLVIGLTFASVRRAYAAVVVANVLTTNRVAAAGGLSAGLGIPVINIPVHVSASTVSPAGLRGTVVGAVTRHQVSGFANTISSAFVNGGGTTPATLATNAAVVGTDLAYISPGGVNTSNTIEIGPSIAEIRIENDEAAATNTYITLIW